MKRSQLIQLLVGIVLSVAMLWWVFKDMKLADMIDSFKSVHYVWLIPSLAVFYFGMWLRGLRWSWLFRPNYRVPVSRATGGMFICFAFNSIFGMRLGEFARSYLVGKRDKTGFSTAFGTVVAERLLDGLTLLACMVVALSIVPIPLDTKLNIDVFGKTQELTGATIVKVERQMIVLCLVLMIGIAMISVARTRFWLLSLMHKARFIPEGIRHRIEEMIHKFAEGLASFHSPGRLVWLFVLSFAAWMTTAASVMFLAWGFDFQTRMGFSQAFALVVIVCIFITVSPTPGYWGFYEAGTVLAIVVMNIHANDALVRSYAILLHLTQYIPIVIVGLPLAWFSHVSVGEIKKEKAEQAREAHEEEKAVS